MFKVKLVVWCLFLTGGLQDVLVDEEIVPFDWTTQIIETTTCRNCIDYCAENGQMYIEGNPYRCFPDECNCAFVDTEEHLHPDIPEFTLLTIPPETTPIEITSTETTPTETTPIETTPDGPCVDCFSYCSENGQIFIEHDRPSCRAEHCSCINEHTMLPPCFHTCETFCQDQGRHYPYGGNCYYDPNMCSCQHSPLPTTTEPPCTYTCDVFCRDNGGYFHSDSYACFYPSHWCPCQYPPTLAPPPTIQHSNVNINAGNAGYANGGTGGGINNLTNTAFGGSANSQGGHGSGTGSQAGAGTSDAGSVDASFGNGGQGQGGAGGQFTGNLAGHGSNIDIQAANAGGAWAGGGGSVNNMDNSAFGGHGSGQGGNATGSGSSGGFAYGNAGSANVNHGSGGNVQGGSGGIVDVSSLGDNSKLYAVLGQGGSASGGYGSGVSNLSNSKFGGNGTAVGGGGSEGGSGGSGVANGGYGSVNIGKGGQAIASNGGNVKLALRKFKLHKRHGNGKHHAHGRHHQHVKHHQHGKHHGFKKHHELKNPQRSHYKQQN